MNLNSPPKLDDFIRYDLSNIPKLLTGEVQPPFPFGEAEGFFDVSFILSTSYQDVDIGFLLSSSNYILLGCHKEDENKKVFFQVRKLPEGTFTLFSFIDHHFDGLNNQPKILGPKTFAEKASIVLKVALLHGDDMLSEYLLYTDEELQEALEEMTGTMLKAEERIQKLRVNQETAPLDS